MLRYGAFPVFPGGLRRPPGALIPHASVTMWAANTIGDDDASDQAGIRASWSTCVMPRASAAREQVKPHATGLCRGVLHAHHDACD
jgi:hypothetical protein